MALATRRLNSECASIVMSTSMAERMLVGADGSCVTGQFAVACIPTLQGFMLGLIDARERILHACSGCIHLSPLAAIKAMQLLDGLERLMLDEDGAVVSEFDNFALSFFGELDDASFAQLARRLGNFSPSEFTEELRRMPDPGELRSVVDRYATDDGETFRLAIEPMYAYMSIHGDIDCFEAEWLERNGLVPVAAR